MKMVYGFLDRYGTKVVCFDSLGIKIEEARRHRQQLADLARQHELSLHFDGRVNSLYLLDGGEYVVSICFGIQQITYRPGNFRPANQAIRIITGNSLLSAIRGYSSAVRRGEINPEKGNFPKPKI